MMLTNHTAFEFLFRPGFVLAPYGTLTIGNDVYAENYDLRYAINRQFDNSAITGTDLPVGFPVWDEGDEPQSGADASGVLSARGAGRWA